MTTHDAEKAADDGLYVGTPRTEGLQERAPLAHLPLMPVFREPPPIETEEES